MEKYRRKKEKNIVVMVAFFVMVLAMWNLKNRRQEPILQNHVENEIARKENDFEEKRTKEITDWQLVLVNYENSLPSDFEIELANIDKIREFDARAIGELKQMMRGYEK